MRIRPVRAADRASIEAMVRRCGAFTDSEAAVAMELVDHHSAGTDPDYKAVCAVSDDDTPVGYLCYGPTPDKPGAWDLYWIVVDSGNQGKGIGTALLHWLEEDLAERNGEILIAETASKPSYALQRRFYEQYGFVETKRVKDYYAPDDDKVVYKKTLSPKISLAKGEIDML